MNAPVVSIITPCFNAERYISDTVRSVRLQAHEAWEQIIIDDGSTDGSGDLIEGLSRDDSRIRTIHQENRGVSSARNLGFRAASEKSRYLLFLDADDMLEPQMLHAAVSYLEARPSLGMVHVGHRVIDVSGNFLSPATDQPEPIYRRVPAWLGLRKLPATHPHTPFLSIFAICWIVPSVVVMRRSVYEMTPGWDESLGHVYEDADLFLNMALFSEIHYLPQPLVRYRRHAGQSTSNADLVSRQEQKLREKWRRPRGLTEPQLATVERAWRFLEGRVLPRQGVIAGLRHLSRLEIKQAARFFGGAARRYLTSFLQLRFIDSLRQQTSDVLVQPRLHEGTHPPGTS